MSGHSIKPRFSIWKRWVERRALADLAYPGVYVLCLSRERLGGKRFAWRSDVVYVGMTNPGRGLAGRLRQFDDTVSGRRDNHGGADRVRYRYGNYARLISRFFMSVRPVICDVTSNTPRDLHFYAPCPSYVNADPSMICALWSAR
jgi:hypothetical protein